ncbi:MAG: RidA family protein [Candidatus Paceibacterota bacterium]
MDLEQRVREIEQRNRRVEADKAWEKSLVRTGTITVATYVIATCVLIVIGNSDAFRNALIPSLGYFLSIQSLPFLRVKWIKSYMAARLDGKGTSTINSAIPGDTIENIYPDDWQETRGVYSPAKKIDLGSVYLIFVSGQQVGKNADNEAATDDIAEQTELVFQALEKTLAAADASLDDVVKAQIFLTDMADFRKVSIIRDKWFAKSKPVSTLVEVKAMTRKGAKVEIEVTAVIKK